MKRLLGIILVLTLLVSMFQPMASASTAEINKTQNELERVSEMLNEVSKDRKKNELEQKSVVKDISNLESQINTLENQIDSLDGSIQTTQVEISDKEVELVTVKKNIEVKKTVLNKRLRVMYKTGSVGYLEVLLGAENFEDLLTRVDAVKLIFLHDSNMIEEQIALRDMVEKIKNDLIAYKGELEGQRKEKVNAQTAVGAKKSKLSVYKKKLVADHKVLEQQVDRLNEDAEKIKKILANLKLSEKYVGGVMTWPAPGYTRISSAFGNRMHPILKKMKLHTGVDIAVPANNTIVAAQAGTVIHADWLGGYGKVIMIDHGGGIVTLYAHNNKLLVKVGDVVTRGQAITKSGSTGRSTGPHLHFEVRVNGDYVDPMTYVTK